MKTQVKIGEFKGNKTFAVEELDEAGQPKQYPIISFGVKKAKVILQYAEEIKKFVEENDKGKN